MSKLEKLVADRELCERIPANDFLDAAFAWHYTEVAGFVCRTSGCEQFSGKQWQLERSTSGRIIRYRQRGEVIYPAPTLQEILDALDNYEMWVIDKRDNHHITTGWACGDDKNAATAALKLWLELNKKGVENE